MSNLIIKNLNLSYEDKVIFDSFNIEFEEKKVNVILGPSGIGKTTLLNSISGILPYSGEITGNEGGVSYIFQKDRLIPSISIYKNLDLIIKAIYKDKKERAKQIDKMLELLEISDCKNKYPTQLSGGQLQRVSIARAFLFPSKVLLLDEPFKEMDTALKNRLIKVLLELNNRDNKTIVFVTHAIDECLLSASNIFLVANSPAEIIYSCKIDTNPLDRNLSDEELVETRMALLSRLDVWNLSINIFASLKINFLIDFDK